MSELRKSSRKQFLGMAGGAVAAGSLVGTGVASAASAASRAIPAGGGQKFYFIAANENDPYYVDVKAGLKMASQWFGVNASITGTPDVNVQNLVQVIETQIARSDTRGLVIPVIDEKAYLPAFEDAAKKGIPVVTYNVDTSGPRIGYVGPSDPELIAKATQLMGAKLNGAGQVAFVSQIVTQQPLRERGVLFKADLHTSFPKIQFVGSYNYDGTANDLLNTVSAILTKYPKLAGLFIGDGSGGPGAAAIKKQAPNVALLLEDIVEASRDAVKAGDAFACLGASVFDTTFQCVQALYQWNTGLRVPDTQFIAQAEITPANVKAFIADPYKHAKGAVTA